MTTQLLSEDDIALAGEYVLGLIDADAHSAVEARIATEPAFAAEVAAWQERLQPMLEGEVEQPPAPLWQKITSGIGADIVPKLETGQGNLPSRLRMWQGIAFASMAASVLMAVVTFTRPAIDPPAPSSPLIAALGSETGKAAMTASYDPASAMLTLTPVAMDTGKLYPELWVIPEGGAALSLGIISRDRPHRLKVAPELRAALAKGALLAVTPEPEGGAPGGKATGPVIASGKITTI